jgi:chromosome segregation ATPase
MLRTLVIMMAVSTALVMMACTPTLLSSSVASSPQQLAMETKQVVRDIRNEEQNVFNILHDNVQKINQLKGQADNDPTKSLNEAVTQLEEVTAVSEDKAAHKEEVRKEILQKVGKLHDLKSRAQDELAKLQEKRSGFQQEIAKANVEGGNHAEVKKKALDQANPLCGRANQDMEQVHRYLHRDGDPDQCHQSAG